MARRQDQAFAVCRACQRRYNRWVEWQPTPESGRAAQPTGAQLRTAQARECRSFSRTSNSATAANTWAGARYHRSTTQQPVYSRAQRSMASGSGSQRSRRRGSNRPAAVAAGARLAAAAAGDDDYDPSVADSGDSDQPQALPTQATLTSLSTALRAVRAAPHPSSRAVAGRSPSSGWARLRRSRNHLLLRRHSRLQPRHRSGRAPARRPPGSPRRRSPPPFNPLWGSTPRRNRTRHNPPLHSLWGHNRRERSLLLLPLRRR